MAGPEVQSAKDVCKTTSLVPPTRPQMAEREGRDEESPPIPTPTGGLKSWNAQSGKMLDL